MQQNLYDVSIIYEYVCCLTWDGNSEADAATRMQAPLPVWLSRGAHKSPPHISAMRLDHTPTSTKDVACCAPA